MGILAGEGGASSLNIRLLLYKDFINIVPTQGTEHTM